MFMRERKGYRFDAGRRLYVAGAVLLALLAAVGCKGTKAAADSGASKRYERKPIVERSDEQLKTEAMLIDAKMLTETGHFS